jgi:hypothetical protein
VTAALAEDPAPHGLALRPLDATASASVEPAATGSRRARRHLEPAYPPPLPLLLSVTDPYAGCGNGELGTAMEPSLAIGGTGASRRFVATWYQDFAGATTHMTQGVGLVAAFSGDGVAWTERTVPFTSCFPGGPKLATTGNARVAVGPDGTTYFVSVSNVPNVSLDLVVTATSDGGNTWAPSYDFGWGDEPSITADPLVPGRAWATWLKFVAFSTTTSVGIATTDSYGRYWTKATILVPWSNWPTIVVDPATTPETLYCFLSRCQNGVSTDYDILLRRSTDAGVSWSDATTVFNGPGAYGPRPSAVVGPDGAVYVAWDAEDGSGNVLMSVSRDTGEHWSTPATVPNASGRPSLAVTSSGLIGVFYMTNSPWPMTQYFEVTTNDGLSFSSPSAVSCRFDRSGSPLGGFLGDYTITAASDGDELYSVWAATPCEGSDVDATAVSVYLTH